MKHNKQNMT